MKVAELIAQLQQLATPDDEVIVGDGAFARCVIGVECGSDGAWLILEGEDQD